MSDLQTKLGVIIGMISVPLIFFYGLGVLLDTCAYDAPCGRYEKPLMLLLLVASVVLGVLLGWLSRLTISRILRR